MTHDDKINELVGCLRKAARNVKSAGEYLGKHDLNDADAERLNSALREVANEIVRLDDIIFESGDLPEEDRKPLPFTLEEPVLGQFDTKRLASAPL